ncbi:NAD(P)H-quinone oxidoreductase subunit H chloroplastic [Bienertia sinuspersici]
MASKPKLPPTKVVPSSDILCHGVICDDVFRNDDDYCCDSHTAIDISTPRCDVPPSLTQLQASTPHTVSFPLETITPLLLTSLFQPLTTRSSTQVMTTLPQPEVTNPGRNVLTTPLTPPTEIRQSGVTWLDDDTRRIPLTSFPFEHQNPKPWEDQIAVERRAMERQLSQMLEMISRIPGMPPSIEKTPLESYADSPFVTSIAMTEIRKRFGATLTGPALTWFINLLNNKITSFAYLADLFNTQFVSSRKLRKQSSDMYRITKRSRESRRSYLNRFIKEKMEIVSPDVSTVDAQAKALAYITLEEDIEARKAQDDFSRKC